MMSGDRAQAPHPEMDLISLRGRILACGEQTRARVARLLGLEQRLPPHVERVLWVQDHLEIRVQCATGELVDLVLEQAKQGQSAFLVGAEVSLWSRQPEIPKDLRAALLSTAAKLLPRVRSQDLSKVVALDPDVTPASLDNEAPAAPDPEGISIPSAARHALSHVAFYADFFAAPEIRRAGCDIIDVHTAHTLVSHGDVECSYCAVCVPRPRTALLRLPVYETVRNIGRFQHGIGAFNESEDLADIASSDMTEQDVILSSPGKMEQVLRYADGHRKKDSLLVIGLCLPDVIGEDQASAVEQYRETTSTPVLMVPASPRSWAWLAKDMLLDRRKATEAGEAPRPDAINLIGFSDNEGLRDLRECLDAIGVQVNACVLPALSMGEIERLQAARLSVYLPNVHWHKAYEHLQDDPHRVHLTVDGPYGIDATQRWLRAVCAGVGSSSELSEFFAERLAPLLDEWTQLRREARGHRLGLVVSARDIATLTDARFTWGIPLASALQEMGFGLDLFVEGGAATVAQHGAELGDAVEVYDFDSLSSLNAALSRSACRAVFSNYVYDWRLVCAGKAPFSTLEFEMGFSGAVATLRRLLSICRLPLFRLGRRFLMSTAPQGSNHGA